MQSVAVVEDLKKAMFLALWMGFPFRFVQATYARGPKLFITHHVSYRNTRARIYGFDPQFKASTCVKIPALPEICMMPPLRPSNVSFSRHPKLRHLKPQHPSPPNIQFNQFAGLFQG